MTREEAAKRIKEIQKLYVFTPTINEALDLAIEALVLQDKYVKALERMIDGAKEINKFLEEAAKKSDEKHQLSEETSTNEGDAETAMTTDCDDCIWNTCNYNKIDWEVSEDCISRQQAIEALTGWETEPLDEDIVRTLNNLPPVTPTEQNEEDVLKFYYVESLDEYWIGQRCGTRYYGKWTGNCFTYGYSRYLPWGEHVVAPDTLWKEHTYPSEPKEIPFNGWLQGFLEKECQTERTGEWVSHELWDMPWFTCSGCNYHGRSDFKFCPNCGAKMKGCTEND